MRVAAVLLAGAFIASPFLPPMLALAPSAAVLAAVLGLPRLMPKRQSANVIGTLRPEKAKRRLFVTAHYDSANCTRDRRLTIFVRFTLIPVTVAFISLLLLRSLGVLPAWPIAWLGLAVIFLPTCAAMFVALRGRVAPGANDNASGVAVMLETARAASESPPNDVELGFVAFGAEEQGLIGSKKFSSEIESDQVAVLNLDTLGTGSRLFVVEGNGIARKRRTSGEPTEALREAGRHVGLKIKSMWTPLAGHDHIPLVRKKIPATTLTAGKLGRNRFDQFVERAFGIPNAQTRQYQYLHTLDDTPERIELGNIGKAGKVVLEFIKARSEVED